MKKHKKHGKHGKHGKGQSAPPLKLPKVAYPLSGRRLRKEVNAQSRLEFGGQRRQLLGEKRASDQRIGQIGNWFDDYKRSLGTLQGATMREYGNQQQGILNRNKAATKTDEGLRQRLRSEAQQDVALRGQNYNPATSELAVAASSERRNLQNVFGGMMGVQRASENSYYNDKRRIGEATKVDQQLRESARGRSVDADLRALAKDRGDFGVKTRADARASERDFYLQRLAFKDKQGYQKFANKQQKTSRKNDAASARQSRKTIRLQSRLNQKGQSRKFHNSSRLIHQGQKGSKHGGGGASRSDRRRASAYLRSAPKGAYHDDTSAVNYLINRGVDPGVARRTVRHHSGGGGHHGHHGPHGRANRRNGP